MSTFADFDLHPSLAQRLTQAGLTTPTPVQQAAIPPALKGQDILAQAKTGSGKTLAFLLPIIEQVMRRIASLPVPGPYTNSELSHTSGPTFLVLAPTRELVLQIEMELRKYAPKSVTSLSVYGGTPIERHYRALQRTMNDGGGRYAGSFARLGRLRPLEVGWRDVSCDGRGRSDVGSRFPEGHTTDHSSHPS